MKDLKSLVGNIQNNGLQNYQKKEVVIDEFAKSIIDKVFSQLSVIFPAWKHAWPTDKEMSLAKMEWTKAFTENNIVSVEQIQHGFLKARKVDTDFLPSCGKFISWCKPTAEDLGYPSESQAMKECIAYRSNQKMFAPLKMHTRPLIIELCKRVDWWLINTANGREEVKKSQVHFSDIYLELCSTFIEPEFVTENLLPTQETIKKNMSEQQKQDMKKRGLEILAETKNKIKSNKFKGG